MKTLPHHIQESREFVCEEWGRGEAALAFYAPLTRWGGRVWLHPTWAKEARFADVALRAERIWKISGSFWNPGDFTLVWQAAPSAREQEAVAT